MWGFPIMTLLFGWQVHGLAIGVACALAVFAICTASTFQVMMTAERRTDWARDVRRRRWFIFAIFMVGIAATGVEIISTSGHS